MKKPVTTSDTTSVTKITGFLRQLARIELAQRVDRRRSDDLRIEQAPALDSVDMEDSDRRSSAVQKVLPPSIRKCSTTGPSASAGKYCSR